VIALKNTILLAVISVVVETGIGLLLAIAVGRAGRGALLFRTILLLPILLPPIAVGVMWLLIYQYNYGLLNVLLLKLGIYGPPWLASKLLAFPAIVVVDIWHWTSFIFMILLAGIESIPTELSEAARIDGASERKIVGTIILPLLRPTLMIAIVLRTIFAFKIFEEIYLLTNGGPGTVTEVISSYVMKVFFEQSRYGYAAALSVATALFIIIFIVVFQRVQRIIGGGGSR
jgi:multiple sugar transport system permease protein